MFLILCWKSNLTDFSVYWSGIFINQGPFINEVLKFSFMNDPYLDGIYIFYFWYIIDRPVGDFHERKGSR